MNNWISVSQQKPAHGQWALVNVPSWDLPATLAEYSEHDGGRFAAVASIGTIDDICYDCPVSHWMPLPEPPSAEANKEEVRK